MQKTMSATVDDDWREEAGQGGAGLNGSGNWYIIVARCAKGYRLSRVEIGGDEKQAMLEFAEIVGAPALRKKVTQNAVDARVVEDAGGNCP